MTKTIISIFSNTDDAEQAIDMLKQKQYNPKDISIVMKDREKVSEVSKSTGAEVGDGAVSGAATGGVLGTLAGLLVGAGVLPGIGALFIGGPLALALGLTGAAAVAVSGAATGALAGGIIGALTSLGISADDATFYEESIKEGGILVAVPARSGNENEVKDILEQCGADKIRVLENNVSGHQTVNV